MPTFGRGVGAEQGMHLHSGLVQSRAKWFLGWGVNQ